MPKIHKGKRRRKTRIWLADLYFLNALLQPRELVSVASGNELFRVLKTLLENIHGFLHQPLALVAEHVILVHKCLDDDAGPLQQGTGLLLLVCTSDDLLPQRVALGPEPLIALP